MDIKIDSIDELPAAAATFIELTSHRKVFPLSGDLGAGKTTFIKHVLAGMGVIDFNGSPSYSLINTYDSSMFGRIYHFDFYRIKGEVEALDIGAHEMLYSDAICLIEWPEKIKDLIPDNAIWSYISVRDGDTRILTIDI